MTPVAIGTAIGAAALTVGRGAAEAVGKGVSFATELITPNAPTTTCPPKDSKDQGEATELKQRADELGQRIERQLAAAGIQLTEPVELISDGQGGVAVASDHPQAAAIQAALSSDILLERDFSMLSGDYEEFVQTSGAVDMPPTLTVVVPTAIGGATHPSA